MFEVIIGQGTSFSVRLVWVLVLFLGYCLMCGFAECWLSVSSFKDLFVGYIQGGMLASVESWRKKRPVRDDISNPQGDILRRKVKVLLVLQSCGRGNCENLVCDKRSYGTL